MDQLLPAPIAAYFAAKTPRDVAQCFAEDGIASDERRTHRGHDEIRRWREEVAKIDYSQEIISVSGDGDTVTVTCRLTGSFKGSPVELDSVFTLRDGKIAQLSIS